MNGKTVQQGIPSASRSFFNDVVTGMSKRQKEIPCKYLYDRHGSRLFDRICELPEYYPTRTETGIMRRHIQEICASVGSEAVIVEYGAGSGQKTRLLMKHLDHPSALVLVDISEACLAATVKDMREAYPHVTITGLCRDFTRPFRLPDFNGGGIAVVFFPGSTIGNFNPVEAESFLAGIVSVCGSGGGLLIGVDLQKDTDVLEAAYDDKEGVTAAFNLNLLERINREFDADFVPGNFSHRAVYNDTEGCIEMHLVSDVQQHVHIGNEAFSFKKGESILTERSYKYTVDGFGTMAERAGMKVEKVWTDPSMLFSVQYLSVNGRK